MVKSKLLLHISSILLAVCILLASLTTALKNQATDYEFYAKFQKENHIDITTGKNIDQLSKISKGLITYLYSGREDLINDNFNEKEIMHMKDVHALFNLSDKIYNISFILGLIIIVIYVLFKNINLLLWNSAKYIVILLIIASLLVLLISSDFNKFFIMFHEIFFDNDLWLLDPKTDLMIQMLPEKFFSTMSANIAINFSKIILSILGIIGVNTFMNRKNLRGV